MSRAVLWVCNDNGGAFSGAFRGALRVVDGQRTGRPVEAAAMAAPGVHLRGMLHRAV